GRDDEVLLGVDDLARSDEARPPAARGVAVTGGADDVAVAGERVEHEHGVVARLVELAPGLVRDRHGRDGAAALEAHRADVLEPPVARVIADPPRAGGGRRRRDGTT